MQGSQSEVRLAVDQDAWDRMLVSSDWTEAELAERFTLAPAPDPHNDFDTIINTPPESTTGEQRRNRPRSGIRHRRR